MTFFIATSTITVGSCFLSNHLIKKGEFEKAEIVSFLTKVGLVVIGLSAVGFLFWKNPLWELW